MWLVAGGRGSCWFRCERRAREHARRMMVAALKDAPERVLLAAVWRRFGRSRLPADAAGLAEGGYLDSALYEVAGEAGRLMHGDTGRLRWLVIEKSADWETDD